MINPHLSLICLRCSSRVINTHVPYAMTHKCDGCDNTIHELKEYNHDILEMIIGLYIYNYV